MVDVVREAIVGVAGSSLVGLYLFGSLATGDFEAGVSDIDLLAVLAGGPDEQLVPPLRRMHADLAPHPAWDDRIEVVYCSRQGLASCRTDTAGIAVISSGAPFRSSRPERTGSSPGTRLARTGCGCSGHLSTC